MHDWKNKPGTRKFILVSMLLPVLNSAREKANMIYCTGNLKQMSSANIIYAGAFDDYCVAAYLDTTMGDTNFWGTNTAYLSCLTGRSYPFVKDSGKAVPAKLLCPTVPLTGSATYYSPGTTYALNVRGIGGAAGYKYTAWRLGKIRQPSQKPLFGDAGTLYETVLKDMAAVLNVSCLFAIGDGQGKIGGWMGNDLHLRHGGKANVANFDGSARNVGRHGIPPNKKVYEYENASVISYGWAVLESANLRSRFGGCSGSYKKYDF